MAGDAAGARPMGRGAIRSDGAVPAGDRVEQIGPGVLTVVIHQGKNRQVRRMCAAAGLSVRRLIRVREGELVLGELKPGAWRALSREEIALLRQA